jgi:hypothetical protein
MQIRKAKVVTVSMTRLKQVRRTERPERSMRRTWLVPLIAGIVSVAVGLIVLATPWTVAQLAVFAAFIFIFRGVTVALNALEGRAPCGWASSPALRVCSPASGCSPGPHPRC